MRSREEAIGERPISEQHGRPLRGVPARIASDAVLARAHAWICHRRHEDSQERCLGPPLALGRLNAAPVKYQKRRCDPWSAALSKPDWPMWRLTRASWSTAGVRLERTSWLTHSRKAVRILADDEMGHCRLVLVRRNLPVVGSGATARLVAGAGHIARPTE